MIRKLNREDDERLMMLLKQDVITNYFIILGLERERCEYEEMFVEKWGEFDRSDVLIAAMLKRKTGNVQFYADHTFDLEAFSNLLNSIGFKQLIGEERLITRFKQHCTFSKEELGPFISRLDTFPILDACECNQDELKKLEPHDIPRVIDLYKKTFKGFATAKSMMDKLENGTGRGYYLERNGAIVSIAQTTYEEPKAALITGVATHPDYRKLGYASVCLTKLVAELTMEGKTLYLQYDNEAAGSIYKRMGFYDIGRMVFYYSK